MRQNAYGLAASHAALRPRVVNDAILLGTSTLLAKRVVRQGYWHIERPDEPHLAALLSVAYGKRILAGDPQTRAIAEAVEALWSNRDHDARATLARLPEPPADCADRLAVAERLLKAGAPPADLENAVRRAPLGLRPAPSYAEGLVLCDQGVVLGKGTVIAALADFWGGRTVTSAKRRASQPSTLF